MNETEAVTKLEQFRDLIVSYRSSPSDIVRRQIMQGSAEIEHLLKLAGCWVTVTAAPPPAVGGLIQRDVNPFSLIFDRMFGQLARQTVCDAIDKCIGAISRGVMKQEPRNEPSFATLIEENYAFVAMPIDPKNKELQDVLDSIKEVAKSLGIVAERVDEQHNNERITDRILDSIRRAKFVVCDISLTRANVYFEAGYAHALGKVPIYLAKKGTVIQFDIKDYPVIFFENMRELREGLSKRLNGLLAKQSSDHK